MTNRIPYLYRYFHMERLGVLLFGLKRLLRCRAVVTATVVTPSVAGQLYLHGSSPRRLRAAPRTDRISRQHIVRGAAATAVATTLGTPSVHARKDQKWIVTRSLRQRGRAT